jgi:hypothetical protein
LRIQQPPQQYFQFPDDIYDHITSIAKDCAEVLKELPYGCLCCGTRCYKSTGAIYDSNHNVTARFIHKCRINGVQEFSLELVTQYDVSREIPAFRNCWAFRGGLVKVPCASDETGEDELQQTTRVNPVTGEVQMRDIFDNNDDGMSDIDTSTT